MSQVTLEQALQIARQHHHAGQLPQAENLYRQILAYQPHHAEVLHLLGILCSQVKRNDLAVDFIRRAIALGFNSADAHSNLGNILREMGQLDASIAACRQAITLRPDLPEAHNNLGIALRDNGQVDEAIAAFRRAVALRADFFEAHKNLANALTEKGELDAAIAALRQAIVARPQSPELYGNLGIALKDSGRVDEAIAAYRAAISLKPIYAEVHNNLGAALKDKGELDEAIACCRQAITLDPGMAVAYSNLGAILNDKGELDKAIAACRRAIAMGLDIPEAHSNLGNALKDKGLLDEAIVEYRHAIAQRPGYAEAHNNLGAALKDQGRLDEAIAAFGQAISLKPNYAEAHGNLGNALKDKGLLDEAVAAYRHAISLKPNDAQTHSNLGAALKDRGELDESIAASRQAIALKPNYPDAHSNLIYTLHFHPGYSAAALAQEYRLWNRQYAEPLKQFIRPHTNDRNPDRRLRIGYVSPDFCAHVVGQFMLPLLTEHDRNEVQVFAYAYVPAPDAMTRRLRPLIDEWRSIVGLSDAQVADLIRRDQIDILVDLTMHTAHNRLLVFAQKPAPVQVTYLAYCSSTGLETIDYRLSDPHMDPPGMDESIYSEQTIRLLETYWCYQPCVATQAIGPVPAMERGYVTFGCLNNFAKINQGVLQCWGKILRAVPHSQLLLHANEGSHRQRVLDQLAQEGIEPQRVRFAGKTSLSDYFRLYNGIDIALDPFPYGGGTTTCDALWMGVPAVTLAGQTAVGRGGVSILSNIGLPEWVARSQEQYMQIAGELANDLPRLGEMRSTLRRRMEQSPLMDAPRFARNIESAYRRMWQNWCAAAR